MTNNTFDSTPRANTNLPDPSSGYSDWTDAMEIRRTWMRMMGMDDDEIEGHCQECPAVDLDEEIAQYNAMFEVERINGRQ